MELTPELKKAAKSRGFLSNRGTDNFSVRVVTGNGVITSEQAEAVAEAARRFGSGKICFTVRMCIEIPGIPYENLDAIEDFIAHAGLEVGGTGPRVRPVVACKGTVCVFGLIDTQALALELHEIFYRGWHDVIVPVKFKIGVGGCPNSCAKPDLNDFGIVGCRPEKDGDPNATYLAFVGGRWGRQRRFGTPLPGRFTHDEIIRLVEKSILFYKSEGQKGERFGSMLDRIGVDDAVARLMSSEFLDKKQAILAK